MQYFIFAVRIILFMLFPLSLIATNDHGKSQELISVLAVV